MTVATLPPLRSRTIPELLDQAIRFYRKDFLKFIGIVAIVQIPISIFQMVTSLIAFSGFFSQLENLDSSQSDPMDIFGPAYFIGIGSSMIIGLLAFLLIQGITAAALSRIVAGNYVGESLGIIEAYRKIGPSWVPLILTMLLALVVGIVLFIWTLIPCVGWLTGLGMLFFFWTVIVPLVVPIVIIEKQTPLEAIRRAWNLSRRRFWWVILFVFILFIFNLLVISGPVALLSYVFQMASGGPFNFSTSQLVLQTALQSTLQLAMSLLYLPLQFIAIFLLYFDLRIRTEGFDLALQSKNIEGTPLQFEDLAAGIPQPEQGNLITMTEAGYFALIEIGGLVLYFILVFLFGALFLAMLGASGGSGF